MNASIEADFRFPLRRSAWRPDAGLIKLGRGRIVILTVGGR
jgi:hypothetical protein